ncbi:MAG: cell division protein FtsA [Candidatus Doudnabacteria bacterium]|nr:cell division protein FtsA [Candidatus Doudnabacteria bacterium]MCA9387514.1 cell division protein FtsA [Candidatus Andersenbacteria bacterium]
MATNDIIVGIDVGSGTIRAVVGRAQEDEEGVRSLHVIGVGEATSGGMRRGVIVDIEEAVSAISEALEKAERTSGMPIERAFVSASGTHIQSQTSKGVIAVSRADNEIAEDDVQRVVDAASTVSVPPNQEILHVVPQSYSVDTQENVKDPVGMSGIRLEVEATIISGSSAYVKNLTKCVQRAGVEIEGIVIAPMAASMSVLTKRQKELGVALVDVGAGTTSLIVFEEGDMLHSAILPVGSGHITNDLAIGLRTSVDVADKVKLKHGSADPKEFKDGQTVDLRKLGGDEDGVVSRKEIAEIIEARLSELFDLVGAELKEINRQGQLPGGIVLVGGGAKLPGLVDVAKDRLKLPAQIGFPERLPGLNEALDDPSFAVAQGLVLWGYKHLAEPSRGLKGGILSVSDSVGKIKERFKAFLP